jgi:Skp family chaperone for outer membrane proteins
MRTQLTKITLAVSIVLAMAFTFSFSQEVVRLAEPPENLVAYDKTDNLNHDSLTIALLKEAQTFYSNSFKDLLTAVSIAVALIGILVITFSFLNSKRAKELKEEAKEEMNKLENNLKEDNEKIKNQLKEQQKEIQNGLELDKKSILELKKKLKKEIEESLEKYKEEIQDRFSILFRSMSRRHHELARERLGKNEFSWYYFDMHIFCRCLKEIRLNKTDLKKLMTIHGLFMNKPKKDNIEDRPTLIQNIQKILLNVYEDDEPEKKKFFCWFVESLLEFIEHCDSECHDTEQKPTEKLLYEEFFEFAKLIYNDICGVFGYDKIKKELREHLIDKPDEILKLAENYRDKSVGINTK